MSRWRECGKEQVLVLCQTDEVNCVVANRARTHLVYLRPPADQWVPQVLGAPFLQNLALHGLRQQADSRNLGHGHRFVFCACP